MGVSSRRGQVIPKFSALRLAAKLCIRPQTFYMYKNMLEFLYHRAKCGGARISPATGAAKKVEFFVCLFVC